MATKKTVKKTLSPKGKKIKEDLEREWESIIIKDKKKALEVPCIRYQGGKELCFCDECMILDEEPKMSLTDKITWVLTVVNVAIFITLIIKNV